jgi:hypothetical protein
MRLTCGTSRGVMVGGSMPGSLPPSRDDLAASKQRARAAWLSAKAKAAALVPTAIADRIWTNGLLAISDAAPVVQRSRLARLEATFRLLADQGAWAGLAERQAPAATVAPSFGAKSQQIGRWKQIREQGECD